MNIAQRNPSEVLEEQRKRVDKAISTMIIDMYRTHLRKMQAEMHTCAVSCCNDLIKLPTMDNVQNCIDGCAVPLLKAQDCMQQELGQFQMHLQRCVTQCNDDIRGKIPMETGEADLIRYRNQFEQCTVKCVDKQIDLIPNMMKTIKAVLAKGPPNMRQI